ncbi:MAG: hypothetical protein R8F63_08495 [Acidimicrobiales bacterium]|nr:hypothetical protein [Acidimicrobiales bacterium]
MQQDAARSFVDALGAADESGAGLLDHEVDLDIVGSITSESVDLVDDHVGGRFLDEVAKHPLEFGSGTGACALASIDKLFNDDCSEGLCLAAASLTLSRDGEAFAVATSLGLFLCGNPQVDDGGRLLVHAASSRVRGRTRR